MADIESGRAGGMPPTAESPVLVAFVRAIGLKAKDVQSLTGLPLFRVRSPSG